MEWCVFVSRTFATKKIHTREKYQTLFLSIQITEMSSGRGDLKVGNLKVDIEKSCEIMTRGVQRPVVHAGQKPQESVLEKQTYI